MDEYIAVGKIVAPFGVRGEMKMLSLTDFPERFTQDVDYYLYKQKRVKMVNIEGVKNRDKDMIIKLEGIETPEDAEIYRNALLKISKDDVVPLPKDHYYHYQLVGLSVSTEEGVVLGKVTEIVETGSNDVYVVKSDQGKEILIPALKEVVRSVDLNKGSIVVRPLLGLLEG